MRFNQGAIPIVPATDKEQILIGTLGAGLAGRDTMFVPRKTSFLFNNVSIAITDSGGAAGGQGGLQIYQFPEGVIQVMGALMNVTIRRNSTGIVAGAAVVGAVGTTLVSAADATLTTTEADLVASTAMTLTAGAGAGSKHGSLVATAYDGHTTPIKAFLNFAVPDADITASDALIVNGEVRLFWYQIGDY